MLNSLPSSMPALEKNRYKVVEIRIFLEVVGVGELCNPAIAQPPGQVLN